MESIELEHILKREGGEKHHSCNHVDADPGDQLMSAVRRENGRKGTKKGSDLGGKVALPRLSTMILHLTPPHSRFAMLTPVLR